VQEKGTRKRHKRKNKVDIKIEQEGFKDRIGYSEKKVSKRD
jgi:hypothetical protein